MRRETTRRDHRNARKIGKQTRLLMLGSVLLLGFAFATPADADSRYNSKRSGHPLRIIGYVLHPVGYLLDTVIARPLHWVVTRESLEPIFGHTDD